jgi:hypothetical protein
MFVPALFCIMMQFEKRLSDFRECRFTKKLPQFRSSENKSGQLKYYVNVQETLYAHPIRWKLINLLRKLRKYVKTFTRTTKMKILFSCLQSVEKIDKTYRQNFRFQIRLACYQHKFGDEMAPKCI